MAARLRVCPAFKFYWVKSRKVGSIKRHDHNKPSVTPEDILTLVKEVYPTFDPEENVLKYQEGDELIDLSTKDVICFHFNESFSEMAFFVFCSKLDAIDFVPPLVAARRTRAESSAVSAIRSGLYSALALNRQRNFTSHSDPSIQDVHPNIICDLCDSDISTARYKCLECENFDMCTVCANKGWHNNHLMILVPVAFLKSQGPHYSSTLAGITANAKKSIPQVIE